MDAHMKWLITYEYRLQTVKCEEKKSASPSHNYFMLLPFSIKPELKDHVQVILPSNSCLLGKQTV